MIHIRSEYEIEKIRSACRLASHTMENVRDVIKPGITTLSISEKAKDFIESNGGEAAFLGYNGFPGAICVSVNEEVVHGIPGTRILEEGDVVKIDLGTYLGGFYGDMARTYPVGKISEETAQLMVATEQSLYEGIKQAVSENHTGDIGYAVQHFIEHRNYSVVRMLVGHGIGRNLHEEPQVPNFGKPGTGSLLKNGIALAIEPMVNAGTHKVNTLSDEWTVVTDDGKLSTHFENTCIVRDGTPEILTLMEGEEIWQKKIQ
ncbi:MAG: type I methionyl aminopeptidase [Candidatus Latescibacteria bacterium]|jgi:methionyl aminopeptidase|nr:type I methionyl aminopeptidase [Candidatus Latescibacterota bacterium]